MPSRQAERIVAERSREDQREPFDKQSTKRTLKDASASTSNVIALRPAILMRGHRRLLEVFETLWSLASGGVVPYAFAQIESAGGLCKMLGVKEGRLRQLKRDLIRWGWLRQKRVCKLTPAELRALYEQSDAGKRAAENWQQNVYAPGPKLAGKYPLNEESGGEASAGDGRRLSAAP